MPCVRQLRVKVAFCRARILRDWLHERRLGRQTRPVCIPYRTEAVGGCRRIDSCRCGCLLVCFMADWLIKVVVCLSLSLCLACKFGSSAMYC